MERGIGNNMAMWVARNLLEDHCLVDPFIPYNAKHNDVLKDTFFYRITKTKSNKLTDQEKDEFISNLIDDCNNIIFILYEENERIKSKSSNIISINYIKRNGGSFSIRYNGENKKNLKCSNELYKRLRGKFDKEKAEEDENRNFNEDIDTEKMNEYIFSVVLRYKTLMGDSHQFAMKPLFKEALKKKHGVQMELFGSPINSHYNMYCSLFWDLEKHFGSYGNFNLLEMEKGFYIANPPYENDLLGMMVDKFFSAIESDNPEPLAISYGMPDWTDYTFDPLEKSNRKVDEIANNQYFKKCFKKGEVKWYNMLNKDTVEIPSHCRFVIQNKSSMEQYKIEEFDFNRLIDNYWIKDNDLKLLDIGNVQEKNLEIDRLKKLDNDKNQTKKWKMHKHDSQFENFIYRMDLLGDNHISEIVLGKNIGIKENYIFFVYLINKENKLIKDESRIGYLTIKKSEWEDKVWSETYKKPIGKSYTLDVVAYKKMPTFWSGYEEKVKTIGHYKKVITNFFTNAENETFLQDGPTTQQKGKKATDPFGDSTSSSSSSSSDDDDEPEFVAPNDGDDEDKDDDDVEIENIYQNKEKITVIEIVKDSELQRQDGGASCGRNALNNFFGGKVFEKGNLTDVIRNLDEPISLLGLCSLLYDLKIEKDRCQSHENYSVIVLQIALKLTGYKVTWINDNDIIGIINTPKDNKNVLGFIFNLSSPQHWTCGKINDDGNYSYYDSLEKKPIILDEDLITNVNKRKNIVQILQIEKDEEILSPNSILQYYINFTNGALDDKDDMNYLRKVLVCDLMVPFIAEHKDKFEKDDLFFKNYGKKKNIKTFIFNPRFLTVLLSKTQQIKIIKTLKNEKFDGKDDAYNLDELVELIKKFKIYKSKTDIDKKIYKIHLKKFNTLGQKYWDILQPIYGSKKPSLAQGINKPKSKKKKSNKSKGTPPKEKEDKKSPKIKRKRGRPRKKKSPKEEPKVKRKRGRPKKKKQLIKI